MNFEKVRTNQNWISWFLMFLRVVKVWNHSRGFKECVWMIRIGWNQAKLGLPIPWTPRVFWLWNRVLEAIFLFFLMLYALYIYNGWILGWIQEQILINQCKKYLILYEIKSSFFDPIFINFLPNQCKFRNLPALMSCLDLKNERKNHFAFNFDFIPYFLI